MKRLLAILAAATLCTLHIQAQNKETTTNFLQTSPQWGITAGYYTNRFSNPGFMIGGEIYLSSTKNYKVLASLQYNFFTASGFYTAHHIAPRIGFRATADFGLLAESYFGIGYIYRQYQYDQYILDGNGTIVNQGRAGISSAVPNVVLGIGYDFSKNSNLPLTFFTRPSVSFFYPNGQVTFEATFALEAGIIVSF
jgi:hypothetical protein